MDSIPMARGHHGRLPSTLLGLQSGWFPWHSMESTSQTAQAAKEITGHGDSRTRWEKGPGKQSVVELKDT